MGQFDRSGDAQAGTSKQLTTSKMIEDKSFEQVGREIAVSGLDRQAAQALDSNNIDLTAKLFEDAYKGWGSAGVKELADRASQLEKHGKGLDLKFYDAAPEQGDELLSSFRVVQSRSALSQFIADKRGLEDMTVDNTALRDVIGRANSDWYKQALHVRSEQIQSGANVLADMFKSGRKEQMTDALLNYLKHKNYSDYGTYVNEEKTIGSYLKGPTEGRDYGLQVIEELRKRLPNTDIDHHLPQLRARDCEGSARYMGFWCTEFDRPRESDFAVKTPPMKLDAESSAKKPPPAASRERHDTSNPYDPKPITNPGPSLTDLRNQAIQLQLLMTK